MTAPGATRDVVILAGGLGTRVAAALHGQPKALAAVAGRPFLDWQLEYLSTQRVDRIVLAVGHLADAIMARYGARFERLALLYAREAVPLGTGGAVRHAMQQFDCDAAYVTNGDTLLPIDLDVLCARPDDDLVIAVRRVDDVARYGAVGCVDGRVTSFGEKNASGPGLANAGTYWMRRSVASRWSLPTVFSLERDLLAAHGAELRPRCVEVDAPFIDIGTPEALAAAQATIPALWHHLVAPR